MLIAQCNVLDKAKQSCKCQKDFQVAGEQLRLAEAAIYKETDSAKETRVAARKFKAGNVADIGRE